MLNTKHKATCPSIKGWKEARPKSLGVGTFASQLQQGRLDKEERMIQDTLIAVHGGQRRSFESTEMRACLSRTPEGML